MKIEEILARNVRLYRSRLELTQDELANACNDVKENDALANRSFISDIENCRRNIALDKIGILAEALGVEPYKLFLTKDIGDKL